MAQPTTPHIARYAGIAPRTDDGRLLNDTVLRNLPPMVAALARLFDGTPGTVLEIGCGTGQHAASYALAFPELAWWPSDPDPDHRASARAWAAHLRAPDRPPLDVDASGDWAADPAVAALGPLRAVLASNVIHISPFAVAEGIVAGAARALETGGLLLFYGPFRENGAHTGEGNRRFDEILRAENPAWGVRDTSEIADLARAHGLGDHRLIEMPANNRLLVLRKS